MLAARSYELGLCRCYAKGFSDPFVESRVKKLLNIPSDVEVICMISIGCFDEKPEERNLKDYCKIVQNDGW